MIKKIDAEIVGYKVLNTSTDEAPDNIVQMHEKVDRPEMLHGSTYKIKTPASEHALYITINDIILNTGTDSRAAPPVRSVHQLQEHGSLSVGGRVDPGHFGSVSQRWVM